MQPKISIITPSFNSEKTIEKTILSVINQQKTSILEYIVVDGGSTDKTCEIVNKYANNIDINIDLLSEPDSGAYDAMNKGIQRASGEIIGIINSDDWYLDNAIKNVHQEFDRHSEIDILYSPIQNYYQGEYIATFIPGQLDKLPIRFTLNHPSCFIKKSAYIATGLYDLQYKIAADYDLILRLFINKFKFHFIETPLAAYSLNGMSSSPLPWDRAKLIAECWKISNKASVYVPESHQQRIKAYTLWIINEIFALPARYFLKPPTARKLKSSIKQLTKTSVSEYGKW
ncbi:glycosyltransferase family 2 protein [Rivularia sp. UHCC 0363]|uniref:glycosyltransferase family 2 protein n=1 Tax=Rivularia sp. UHCC 0363 TaxID=3110244 RepID=UPI002B1F5B34|nr:glycosyltransferase family 2 protein [Rivularia sp. UHCC 0363]MEA5598890.1 glycosyltransferase family 2 protein [Rivularia sp. UHCC 0363]